MSRLVAVQAQRPSVVDDSRVARQDVDVDLAPLDIEIQAVPAIAYASFIFRLCLSPNDRLGVVTSAIDDLAFHDIHGSNGAVAKYKLLVRACVARIINGEDVTSHQVVPVPVARNIAFAAGNHTDDHKSTESLRDLGFWGNIGGTGILTYGDTFICPSSNPLALCTPLSANSAAVSDPNTPLIAHDFNLDPENNSTAIFCDYTPSEAAAHPTFQYGMGLTNVVETDSEQRKGVVFFLKNFRPLAVDQIQGSGVAEVWADGGEGFPTCERKEEIWWDGRRPYWGDHSILKDPLSDYLYIYGGYPSSPTGPSDVYLARVPIDSTLDKSAYTYWDGASFTSSEILDQTPSNRSAAVMLSVPQGSAWYSSVWSCYVYFSTSSIDPWVFVILTAPAPEGPWSGTDRVIDGNKVIPAQSVYNARENVANEGMEGSFAYSPAVQPQFDESGGSVVVSYTFAPNCVQAVRLWLCEGCLGACDIVAGECGLPEVRQVVDG
ncbi:MAG: hypothetical protein M1831_007114 [Alyxoria varia]|nr:MAG: hypothetical protein M1831_007114 [Alyxoria varia]